MNQSPTVVVLHAATEYSDLSRHSASYLVFHMREIFLALDSAVLRSAISCSYFKISAQRYVENAASTSNTTVTAHHTRWQWERQKWCHCCTCLKIGRMLHLLTQKHTQQSNKSEDQRCYGYKDCYFELLVLYYSVPEQAALGAYTLKIPEWLRAAIVLLDYVSWGF